jgi:hypothetical protein
MPALVTAMQKVSLGQDTDSISSSEATRSGADQVEPLKTDSWAPTPAMQKVEVAQDSAVTDSSPTLTLPADDQVVPSNLQVFPVASAARQKEMLEQET